MWEEKEPRPSRALRFGVFDVNCAARELRKDGVLILLQPQLFRILSMLLDKPGEIVNREDTAEALGPGHIRGF